MKVQKRQAFTLIELLVVIAIIAILAAILFPVFAKARDKANETTCFNNMKQLGIGLYTYLQDYDEKYPMNRFPDAGHPLGGNLEGTTYNWHEALYPYVKSTAIIQCPTNPLAQKYPKVTEESGKFPVSYSYNGSFFHENANGHPNGSPIGLSEVKDPAGTLFLVESRERHPDLGIWVIPWRYGATGADAKKGWFQSHRGRINFLFCDTHARQLKLSETLTPREMWKDNRYDQAACDALVSQIAPEYQ